jgi:hypothetical protein
MSKQNFEAKDYDFATSFYAVCTILLVGGTTFLLAKNMVIAAVCTASMATTMFIATMMMIMGSVKESLKGYIKNNMTSKS